MTVTSDWRTNDILAANVSLCMFNAPAYYMFNILRDDAIRTFWIRAINFIEQRDRGRALSRLYCGMVPAVLFVQRCTDTLIF